jgi:hypothetical protein
MYAVHNWTAEGLRLTTKRGSLSEPKAMKVAQGMEAGDPFERFSGFSMRDAPTS